MMGYFAPQMLEIKKIRKIMDARDDVVKSTGTQYTLKESALDKPKIN